MSLAIQLFSLMLSAWAIVHWFRQQQPLDQHAARVRWLGLAICASLIAALFMIFKATGKLWVHEHTALLVVSIGVPTFMFLFFVFFPGLSIWLSRQWDARS